MKEQRRRRVDLERFDMRYPVETRQELMPDGNVLEVSVWNRERLKSLLNCILENEWKGEEVVYTGLPPCWVIAAVDHKARPARSFHVTHYLNDSEQEIYALPIGEENEEAEITTEIIEDGDKIFLWVGADDPAVGYHYYDPKRLRKAIAPRIPEGKDLYIIADAATYILLCYEKTYAPLCRSVSVSFFHDRVNDDMRGRRLFTCCYTTGGDVHLGDQTLVPTQMDKRR